MSIFHRQLYSYTPSAISSAEPTILNITRHQFFSSALTGVVVIGFNKSNTIWCSAKSMTMDSRKLQSLHWLYSNSPVIMKCTWSVMLVAVTNTVLRRLLHFKTTKPSAGNYTCAANYEGNINSHQTVDIRVSGEWSNVWLSRLSQTNTGGNYSHVS